MKRLHTIYRILPLLNIGTYWTQFNPEHVIDDYMIDEDYSDGNINYTSEEYWDGFDNRKYTTSLLECAAETLQEEILPVLMGMEIGITGGKVTGMESPKEYNFRDDWLEFYMEVKSIAKTKAILIKLFKEQDDNDMGKFFKETYGSYDGFTSFMSWTTSDILEGIKSEQDDEICQFIYYLMTKADLVEKWEDDLSERFRENSFYWEFLTDEFLETHTN